MPAPPPAPRLRTSHCNAPPHCCHAATACRPSPGGGGTVACITSPQSNQVRAPAGMSCHEFVCTIYNLPACALCPAYCSRAQWHVNPHPHPTPRALTCLQVFPVMTPGVPVFVQLSALCTVIQPGATAQSYVWAVTSAAGPVTPPPATGQISSVNLLQGTYVVSLTVTGGAGWEGLARGLGGGVGLQGSHGQAGRAAHGAATWRAQYSRRGRPRHTWQHCRQQALAAGPSMPGS